jgi:hypothetical protein
MDMSMQASESRAVHAQPAEGMECMCCMESITEENYVEYQYAEGEYEDNQCCMCASLAYEAPNARHICAKYVNTHIPVHRLSHSTFLRRPQA